MTFKYMTSQNMNITILGITELYDKRIQVYRFPYCQLCKDEHSGVAH